MDASTILWHDHPEQQGDRTIVAPPAGTAGDGARDGAGDGARDGDGAGNGQPSTCFPAGDDTQPARAEDSLQVGQRLGKFRIVRRLGSGGQAQAYLASDPDLQREVVIKYYHSVQDEVGQLAVLNEGRALAKVRSPFVAQCYGADRFQGVPYLVLEYVAGETLATAARAGQLPVRRSLEIASQLAEGVAAIHAGGLLHLDLKPANVLIDQQGQPRIVDFGLAATIDDLRTHKISGTPAYMAPEQARGEFDRIGQATDQFGLGAVLYELLTGQPPYLGESRQSIWRLAQAGDVVAPTERRPELAESVSTICMRCLAKDPRDRWASVGELQAQIRAELLPPRRGFGFRMQLGRFKFEISLGIAVASLLLAIVGAARLGPNAGSGPAVAYHAAPARQLEVPAIKADEASLPLDRKAKRLLEDNQQAAVPAPLSEMPLPGPATRVQLATVEQQQADRQLPFEHVRDLALDVRAVPPAEGDKRGIAIQADGTLQVELVADQPHFVALWFVPKRGGVLPLSPVSAEREALLARKALAAEPYRGEPGRPATFALAAPVRPVESGTLLVLARTTSWKIPASTAGGVLGKKDLDAAGGSEPWKRWYQKLIEQRPGDEGDPAGRADLAIPVWVAETP